MENLLLIIKKAPLVTWKAFLVLWALFLGFVGLVIKFLKFMSQFSDGTVGTSTMNKRSSDDGFSSDSLSAQQKHNMDSNGLSRSEAIRNPHW
jgi:hypothetical protein